MLDSVINDRRQLLDQEVADIGHAGGALTGGMGLVGGGTLGLIGGGAAGFAGGGLLGAVIGLALAKKGAKLKGAGIGALLGAPTGGVMGSVAGGLGGAAVGGFNGYTAGRKHFSNAARQNQQDARALLDAGETVLNPFEFNKEQSMQKKANLESLKAALKGFVTDPRKMALAGGALGAGAGAGIGAGISSNKGEKGSARLKRILMGAGLGGAGGAVAGYGAGKGAKSLAAKLRSMQANPVALNAPVTDPAEQVSRKLPALVAPSGLPAAPGVDTDNLPDAEDPAAKAPAAPYSRGDKAPLKGVGDLSAEEVAASGTSLISIAKAKQEKGEELSGAERFVLQQARDKDTAAKAKQRSGGGESPLSQKATEKQKAYAKETGDKAWLAQAQSKLDARDARAAAEAHMLPTEIDDLMKAEGK